MPSMANVFALLADESVDSSSEPDQTQIETPLNKTNMETMSLATALNEEEDTTDFVVTKTRKPKLTEEARAAKAAQAQKQKADLIASGAAKKLEIPQTAEEKQRKEWQQRKAEHQAKAKAAWEARRAAHFERKAKADAERKAAWEAGRPAFLEREARRQQKAAREEAAREREDRKKEEAALHERMTKASIFDYIK